jgi:hypothetical protein
MNHKDYCLVGKCEHKERENQFKFNPPLYLQRYDFVIELIEKYSCKSILDVGCAECKLLKLIKNSNENINLLIGLDICGETLQKARESFSDCLFDYVHSRTQPLDL